MFVRLSRMGFICLIAYSCLIGCRRELRPDGMPALLPCQIKITQDGVPLDQANVRFHPPEGGAPLSWGSNGTTNADGVATIRTQGQYSGAPAGTYRVTVTKEEQVFVESPAAVAARKQRELDGDSAPPNLPFDPFFLVQAEYATPKTTPLTLTLEKGKSAQTFDVGKAVRLSQGRIAAP